MLAVKDAAPLHFLLLNVPTREKGLERVKEKVAKGIEQQGYKNEFYPAIDNLLVVSVKDRKEMQTEGEGVDSIANKYLLKEVQHRGLPQVILVRQASINASMGADITSGDIKTLPKIVSGEEVLLLDLYYNVVGYGISQMSTEEIKRSPGRVAIRTQEGRYDVPKYRNDKRYANGLYSITTLPRILGITNLDFNGASPATILVVCQDDGEVTVEILKRAPNGSKIFILIRNENHFKAVQSTFTRLQIDPESIEYVRESLDRFAKSRPKNKFSHFFLEMSSTETGLRPNPFIQLEEKIVIGNARNQFSALRSISLIGEKDGQIIYVTHSVDPTENEEVIVQGFRQGNFVPSVLNEEMQKNFSEGNYSLPEVPTMSSMGEIDLTKMIEEDELRSSWMSIDPLKHNSDGGFVAKFRLNK